MRRVSVVLHGRRSGAIGIMYRLPGQWEGEGATVDAAIDDARRKAYSAGWEHLCVVSVTYPEEP